MTTTNEYETVEGTKPDVDEQHEPRTLTHVRNGELVHMMSEIGDGTFVAWERCRTCSKGVAACKCPGGPVEPDYIQRWRDERFTKSFDRRSAQPALPESLRVRDRRIAAVMRFLLARGYAILAPGATDEALKAAQDAQDAAYGDSNDTEIDLLREALESALRLLGHDLPDGKDPDDEDAEPEVFTCRACGREEGACSKDPCDAVIVDREDSIIDPDDTEGLSDDPDYGGHVEPVEPEQSEPVDEALDAALERLRKAKEDQPDVGF